MVEGENEIEAEWIVGGGRYLVECSHRLIGASDLDLVVECFCSFAGFAGALGWSGGVVSGVGGLGGCCGGKGVRNLWGEGREEGWAVYASLDRVTWLIERGARSKTHRSPFKTLINTNTQNTSREDKTKP